MKTALLQSICSKREAQVRKEEEGRKQEINSIDRRGEWANRLDGQMDEEAEGLGGIALGWEMKPQINALNRHGAEFPLECKSHIMIWIFVTASYLLICLWRVSPLT